MEPKESDYVASFDTLYTSNHIQILKILLHHLPSEHRSNLAVYIKYMELQYTISHCKNTEDSLCICTDDKKSPDLPCLLNDIFIYCNEKERKTVKQLLDMFQALQMVEEIQKFSELMPSFTEEGSAAPNTGFDISSLLQNMLTPEQQAMFEMFQTGNEG